MIDLAIVALVLAVAVVLSEVRLGGYKLQTALARVLPVWVVIGVMIMAHFAAARGSGAFVFAVFWSGAFLTWFGIRSHVESSILLRMLHLLHGREISSSDLVHEYESLYGPRQRVDELVRSGLLELVPEGFRVTPKGERILAAAAWLR
jgi:hypothetical protein